MTNTPPRKKLIEVALPLEAINREEGATFVPKIPERESWSFAGPFGIYDTAQLQRGYKIYREICSNCHSMEDMHFRNLADPGGPEFTEGQVQALAAEFKVTDGPDDNGLTTGSRPTSATRSGAC